MSQRKARNSLNPPPPSSTSPSLAQIQQFEDFRRRHAKQNREIVTDNIHRKDIIKQLNEQITRLQTELLEVHQANSILRGQLKRIQRENQRANSESTRQALDHIISAVPALRLLRDTLISPSPSSYSTSITPSPSQSSIFNGKSTIKLGNTDNPVATRPAAAMASNAGLSVLEEGSECGSESDIESQVTVVLPIPKSPTASAPGIKVTRYIHTTMDSPSSASSESPSPTKSTLTEHKVGKQGSSSSSPTTGRIKKVAGQKRRRESGLISASNTTTTLPTLTVPEASVDEGETSWDEGPVIDISPEDAVELIKDVTPTTLLCRPSSEPSITTPNSPIPTVVVSAPTTVAGRAAAKNPITFTPIVKSKDYTPLVIKPGRKSERTVPKAIAVPILPPMLATEALPDVTSNIGKSQKDVSGVIYVGVQPQPKQEMEAVNKDGSIEPSSGSSRSPSSRYKTSSSMLFPASTITEDTGRIRRSRQSVVSYKEPSLNKKMRKPDGIAVDEALGLKPRSSLAVNPNPSSPPSSSSNSESLASVSSLNTPTTSLAAALATVVIAPPPLASSSSSTTSLLSTKSIVSASSGVRRKSILPKTNAANKTASHDEEEGDGGENDVDGDDELPELAQEEQEQEEIELPRSVSVGKGKSAVGKGQRPGSAVVPSGERSALMRTTTRGAQTGREGIESKIISVGTKSGERSVSGPASMSSTNVISKNIMTLSIPDIPTPASVTTTTTTLSTLMAPTASSKAKTGPRSSTRPPLPSSIAAWDSFKAPSALSGSSRTSSSSVSVNDPGLSQEAQRNALVDIVDNGNGSGKDVSATAAGFNIGVGEKVAGDKAASRRTGRRSMAV